MNSRRFKGKLQNSKTFKTIYEAYYMLFILILTVTYQYEEETDFLKFKIEQNCKLATTLLHRLEPKHTNAPRADK